MSSSGGSSGDAEDFECNICFDLAQDPIVTLCGHLFCWPCLYKWLTFHSGSNGCPVCKAIVEEDKVVPLYGRGKDSNDPRVNTFQDANIPRRPTGQRPETAPEADHDHFARHGLGFSGRLNGGFAPVASARFGNFTFAAAFSGIFPSLFNLNAHGFPAGSMYGHASGFSRDHVYGHGHLPNTVYRGYGHGYQWSPNTRQDTSLKMLLCFVVFCVFVAFIGL